MSFIGLEKERTTGHGCGKCPGRVRVTQRKPLSLSTDQLAVVVTGAKLLPSQWRSRYLQAIADHLQTRDQIDTADVTLAVKIVLHRLGVGADAA